MSELTCKQVYTLGRSEVRACAVDLGENTAGQETGTPTPVWRARLRPETMRSIRPDVARGRQRPDVGRTYR